MTACNNVTSPTVTINGLFIHHLAKRNNSSISKWSLDIFDRSGEKSLPPWENRRSTVALSGSAVFSRT